MMAELQFTHKACRLPGADPLCDREVFADGVLIGRVVMIDAGEQRGLWRWAGMWIGTNTTGIVETLDEGLQEIKCRVTTDVLKMLPPPPLPWRPGIAWR